MVFMNKSRLEKGIPSKLQMKRIGPCKVLEKYGASAYKIDQPKDMSLSPIFNVKDLIPYKGPNIDESQYQKGLNKDVAELQVPEKT